jgi:hypothetical protein
MEAPVLKFSQFFFNPSESFFKFFFPNMFVIMHFHFPLFPVSLLIRSGDGLLHCSRALWRPKTIPRKAASQLMPF